VLKKHRLQIPVLTVVTDPFTAHPLWFLKHDQHFIVFSERLKQHCIRHGIQEDSLHLFPFVLEEKFSNPVPENNIVELKKRYCADPEKKTLLILGGGDGIPNGYELLKLLLKAKLDCNIIVVCGRNKGLLKKSQDLITKENNNSVFVYGYVDFIYELINVSDVVITKCGASTIMEILFLEKIPIIINYIWEQEKGNVEYVVQNKMGIFEKEIHRVPELVKKLFSEQSYYQEFIAQIDKQHLINGTAAVSEFIRTFK
jgi:processive 1,2-diacylglycerol beta-glucosyltransferase/1,2-diacylglycerol 3-beta-galactosyltransferase